MISFFYEGYLLISSLLVDASSMSNESTITAIITRYEVEVSAPDSFDITCPVRIIHGLKVGR